jgi:putative flippase GtrA
MAGMPGSLTRGRPSLQARAIRFILSSGLATGLHWMLMAALVAQGVNATRATAAGAAAGALTNYLLQFHLTYAGTGRHRYALPAYLLLITLGWVYNVAVFQVLHASAELGIVTAQLGTTLSLAALNFIGYDKVVFHER